MSENKRYYWLKLSEDFFDDGTIEWIEEQDNGKEYVIFYLKLCLRSLKDEGRLIRYVGERLIPYDVKSLSSLTKMSPDTVAVALKTFLEIGLIDRLETGEIYMKQINEMIGSETDSAMRMRKKRALEAKKQELLESQPTNEQENDASQCAQDVQRSDTEIEIEKEIDIDLDKEQEKESMQLSLSDVINFYQNNFGVMSPIILDDLTHWSNDLNPELVVEAMSKAAFNQKPYSYAKGIMNNWFKLNIKSLDQVEQQELQFELNKQQKTQSHYGRSKKVEKLPQHMQRTYEEKPLSAEEQEKLAESEAELRDKLERMTRGDD